MKKYLQKYKKVLFVILIALLIICFSVIIILCKKHIAFFKINSTFGENIYTNNIEYSDIYNIKKQNFIESKIESLISKKNTFDNPLIIYNPYGTNMLALNVYFFDKKGLDFNYEISTPNGVFSKEINIDNSSERYGFQIIGLESGYNNKITIISSDNRKYSFNINIPSYDLPIINIDYQNDANNLYDGLYAYLGMLNTDSVDDLYLSDNYGIIRSIIPLKKNTYSEENSTADNIKFYKNFMFYNIASDKIVKVNKLGKVEDIFSFEGYNKHHDFVIDAKKDKILILVSKNDSNTMEDLILVYDITRLFQL